MASPPIEGAADSKAYSWLPKTLTLVVARRHRSDDNGFGDGGAAHKGYERGARAVGRAGASAAG